MSNGKMPTGTDRGWPGAVQFHLGTGGMGTTEVVWRCEGSRGGRVYTSGLFRTKDEAQRFAQELQRQEPDQSFNVQKIKASAVWN